MGNGLILGIESSCDETAAAVVERGAWTRSSVVASQIAMHAPYGGVVPELASREHLRNIVPITRAALSQAGCTLDDIDAVAVTSGPGLAGALLVGIMYAKALAFARGIPLIAVNHLEGHIHAVLLVERQGSGNRDQPKDRDQGSGIRDQPKDRDQGSGNRDQPKYRDQGSGNRDQPKYRGQGSGIRDQPKDRDQGSGNRDQPKDRDQGSGIRDQPKDRDQGSGNRDQPKDREQETGIRDQPKDREQGSGNRDQPRSGEEGTDLGLVDEGGLAMPALALVVSGGHTHLFSARPPEMGADFGAWQYVLIGRTLDDAAGEAFDKVAKLLGLGYPGGPWIDHLAPFGNPRAVPFGFAQIKRKAHLEGKAPRTKGAKTAPIAELDRHFLFSFSGIKTAVLRYVEVHGLRAGCEARQRALMAMDNPGWQDARALCDQQTLDVIASFQHAVVGDLLRKTFAAAEATGAGSVLVTGGVAANRELRVRFTAEAGERGLPVAFPTLALSTDNAAMIAAAAWPRFLARDFAGLDLESSPRLTLA